MSRRNAVKIKTSISESSGYHFRSSVDDSSYVIASKHGLCHLINDCVPYNDGDPDCCKSCGVKLKLDEVKFHKQKGAALTAESVYSFPNNDLAIVKVKEKSFTPLKIGKLKDNTGLFTAFGYKAEVTDITRLLLNSPEIEGKDCYFNIESNPITELVEKSEGFDGISGSLIIDRNMTDIPIAYSVITTNEESNDLLGEVLYDIDFDELHHFFGTKIFSNNFKKIKLDTSFKKCFKEISKVLVDENLIVSVLVPAKVGHPYFNLNPIAKSLTGEFEAILGHNNENKSMLTVSALRILEQKKELQPAYKLLASRIVESMMNAPHIYSTYIDHSYYHHVHLLNDSENGVEFVVSSYGGEGDLIEQLNNVLGQMVYQINHYAFDAKLISERAFLEVKYTQEECEVLYDILFGEHDEFIENLSIIYCIDLQSCSIPRHTSLEEYIKSMVKETIDNIDKSIIEAINQGLNVNLYVLPMNKSNELTELVENLLK
ncbi:hypothetical protein BZG25_15500 [Salinivibrio sp. ML198]|uniref:hypothetical protein n=1 Tax=Salinivibrio sp. ML198 TaxID=1909458 RepID=UPI0009889736|nr:hypothetical protein [Salinivibrio sp. ML198]OOE76766.1 hypothetical protein BZG25_15500 [Salinivibrio sp. ML198]